jgi:hypothetical protein
VNWRSLPPVFLALTLLWVYGSTLAPDLTWANGGADGGDLIAAAATGGAPHPTGYPVYLLLAGLFQHVPVGPLAFRTNLLSALATVAAALLVYNLARRCLAAAGEWTSRLAGLASAFAFGLTPLVWSQAVITEVYGLHALFVIAILHLSSGLAARLTPLQTDILLGLVFGLSLGNHVTSVFLLPLVFLPAIREPRSLLRRILFLALGLSPYLLLPLRASAQPPVNWGNASTWDGFFWLATGRLYQDDLLSITLTGLWLRTQSAARTLLDQVGILGLGLGVLGAVVFRSNARLHRSMVWVTGAFSVFAILYGVREADVYLMPVFLCLAIWMGVALAGLMNAASRPARVVIILAFAVYLLLGAMTAWPRVDASGDRAAQEFGAAVLGQAPERAILLVKGDEAVFALWYFHFALGQRPDVAVVASDLLHHAWYQESLRAAYPGLEAPGPFPFPETIRLSNPGRPACYVEYAGGAVIECYEAIR